MKTLNFAANPVWARSSSVHSSGLNESLSLRGKHAVWDTEMTLVCLPSHIHWTAAKLGHTAPQGDMCSTECAMWEALQQKWVSVLRTSKHSVLHDSQFSAKKSASTGLIVYTLRASVNQLTWFINGFHFPSWYQPNIGQRMRYLQLTLICMLVSQCGDRHSGLNYEKGHISPGREKSRSVPNRNIWAHDECLGPSYSCKS